MENPYASPELHEAQSDGYVARWFTDNRFVLVAGFVLGIGTTMFLHVRQIYPESFLTNRMNSTWLQHLGLLVVHSGMVSVGCVATWIGQGIRPRKAIAAGVVSILAGFAWYLLIPRIHPPWISASLTCMVPVALLIGLAGRALRKRPLIRQPTS